MKTYRVLFVLIMFASSLLLTGLGGDAGDSPIPFAVEPAFADSSEDEWDEPVVTPPHPYPFPPVANCEILEDPDDLWTYIPINFSSNGSYCRPGLYSGWYITFSWDFGDGTDPSTLANPVHIYEEPGTYNVTLTVTDHPNKDTAQDNIVLTIITDVDRDDFKISIHPYPGPPVANCEILEDQVPCRCPKNHHDLWTYIPINFSSNGSYCRPGIYKDWYITFSWDFGDGTEPSTLANPVHVYEEPGTYNVTLTVTDHPNKDTAHDNIVLTVIYQNNETVPDTLVIINQPNYDDCPSAEVDKWTNILPVALVILAAFATACVVMVFYIFYWCRKI